MFPRVTSLEILQKKPKDLQDRNIDMKTIRPSKSSIFMSMFNDIEWTKTGNSERSKFQIPSKPRTTRRDFRKDTGHSLDLGMN